MEPISQSSISASQMLINITVDEGASPSRRMTAITRGEPVPNNNIKPLEAGVTESRPMTPEVKRVEERLYGRYGDLGPSMDHYQKIDTKV